MFPLLVLVTGSADGFPSPGKCCSFGDGDVTREPSRDSKTCSRNFFSIGIEEEVSGICVCVTDRVTGIQFIARWNHGKECFVRLKQVIKSYDET